MLVTQRRASPLTRPSPGRQALPESPQPSSRREAGRVCGFQRAWHSRLPGAPRPGSCHGPQGAGGGAQRPWHERTGPFPMTLSHAWQEPASPPEAWARRGTACPRLPHPAANPQPLAPGFRGPRRWCPQAWGMLWMRRGPAQPVSVVPGTGHTACAGVRAAVPPARSACTHRLHAPPARSACKHRLHAPPARSACTHRLHAPSARSACSH